MASDGRHQAIQEKKFIRTGDAYSARGGFDAGGAMADGNCIRKFCLQSSPGRTLFQFRLKRPELTECVLARHGRLN
ncbi:hypothetical protein BaRGS_00010980 [Batillaria attramentaria]|uniref:Uncharacterized protein n=1 Tax=Batillaria attramentaria TaxID=370345 RepID=A0ABD0LEF2_9CAEN